MVFKRSMYLELSDNDISFLKKVISENEHLLFYVNRAKILLEHFNGVPVSSIANNYGISRKSVENLVAKTNKVGVKKSILESKKPGRPQNITFDEERWIYEVYRTDYRELDKLEPMSFVELTDEIRKRCSFEGFNSLINISKSTVYNIVKRMDRQTTHKRSDYIIIFSIFEFALGNDNTIKLISYNLDNSLERLDSPYLFLIIDTIEKQIYTKLVGYLDVNKIIDNFDDFLDQCKTESKIVIKTPKYPVFNHPVFGEYLKKNLDTYIIDNDYNNYDSCIINLVKLVINNLVKSVDYQDEVLLEKLEKVLENINAY